MYQLKVYLDFFFNSFVFLTILWACIDCTKPYGREKPIQDSIGKLSHQNDAIQIRSHDYQHPTAETISRLKDEANRESADFLLGNIDKDADPCVNFYKFACGRSSSRSPHSVTSALKGERIEILLRNSIEYPSSKSQLLAKIRTFLDSCEKQQEIPVGRTGIKRLIKPLISLLRICPMPKNVSRTLLDLILDEFGMSQCENYSDNQDQTILCDPENFDWIASSIISAHSGIHFQFFFQIYIQLESKSRIYRIRLRKKSPRSDKWNQMDYYLSNLKNFMLNRFKVERNFIEEQLTQVIEFREKLFSGHQNEISNFKKDYITITIDELMSKAPNTNWLKLLSGLTTGRISRKDDLISVHKSWSIVDLDQLIASTKPQYTMKPVAKRNCVTLTKKKLGLGIFVEYIKNFVNPKARMEVMQLVEMMRNVLMVMLESLSWMSPRQKEFAKEIATTVEVTVGYPDNLLIEQNIDKFYHSLILEEGNFLNNYITLTRIEVERNFGHFVGTKSDAKSLTFYQNLDNPLGVNRVFMKHIYLNVDILDGFFFNQKRTQELNYGIIGFILGHEFAHNFDSNSFQLYSDRSDHPSNWDKSTESKYQARAECFIRQYSEILIPGSEDKLVNGQETLIENQADNFGMKLAYMTMKEWLKREAKTGTEDNILPEPLSHLTSAQLFWLAGANYHCNNQMGQERSGHEGFSHSPDEVRCNVPLINLSQFSTDFSCPIGSPMNLGIRCMI